METFHFHNTTPSEVKFTAAVKWDRANQAVEAAFAFVNPKDQFKKVRGTAIAYARLHRLAMASFSVDAAMTKKELINMIRSYAIVNHEKLRKFIKDNSVVADGENPVPKGMYVANH